MRRLVAATLPDGCLQPDWICESTSSAGTPSGGCVAAWGCLNGDFKLSCGSKLVAGQRDCSCLGSGTPRKVKAPDFCSQGSLPRHIVNKLCGWRLPAAGR